jgi:hypothetical protein
LDGIPVTQWKPLETQPLTGQYNNALQPGAYRTAEGASR